MQLPAECGPPEVGLLQLGSAITRSVDRSGQIETLLADWRRWEATCSDDPQQFDMSRCLCPCCTQQLAALGS